MKLLLTSDLHGYTPKLPLDGIDVVCFIGDYQANDNVWKNEDYFLDLKKQVTTIGVAGNHDATIYSYKYIAEEMFTHYLENTSVRIGDEVFFGTPHILLEGRCFSKTEEELCFLYVDVREQILLELMPKPTIILSHQPAYGILDHYNHHGNLGSKSLLDFSNEIKPKLHAWGHIHEMFGSATKQYMIDGTFTDYLNVSFCHDPNREERFYRPRNKVVTYDTITREVELLDILVE